MSDDPPSGRPSFGKIEALLTAGATAEDARELAPPCFRLALLGDFSGRGSRGLADTAALKDRPIIEIDRDNFDQVMVRLAVELRLPAPGAQSLTLKFEELDHFHPDHLVESLGIFGELRELRRRLLNPTTFAEAAAQLGGWAERKAPQPEAPVSSETEPEDPESPAPYDILAASLAATGDRAGGPAPATGEGLAESLIEQIIAPYVVPAPDPQQAELLAAVDSATGHQLRGILHHADFQALEAAWRALHFLVRRLETGRNLKLALIDVSREELAADLLALEELAASGTYRLLVVPSVATPGGTHWSLLVGFYSFTAEHEAVQLLGRLAKIAAAAGTAFLAAGDARLAGCESFAASPDPDDWGTIGDDAAEADWQALRRLPESAHLGLVLPRLLLRAPYGAKSNPVEQLEFEEIDESCGHESYLWGNPAVAGGYLIAQAFSVAGWGLRAAAINEIGGLPVHVYQEDGESRLLPCGEILMNERGGAKLAERGLMPLWSVQNSDSVQLDPLRSLSGSAPRLQGPWR